MKRIRIISIVAFLLFIFVGIIFATQIHIFSNERDCGYGKVIYHMIQTPIYERVSVKYHFNDPSASIPVGAFNEYTIQKTIFSTTTYSQLGNKIAIAKCKKSNPDIIVREYEMESNGNKIKVDEYSISREEAGNDNFSPFGISLGYGFRTY